MRHLDCRLRDPVPAVRPRAVRAVRTRCSCCASAATSPRWRRRTWSATFAASATPTVRAIVDDLRKAKVDPRIRSVLLKPTGFDSPFWGKVQEVRDAILDFRKSGKPIFAYLEYGGDHEYYLATAADKVFLMPSASLDLSGVATYELFLRGTLDKIGVVPRPAPHRRLQDRASNTFTEKGYTPAHREMDESLNRDLYRAARARHRRRPARRTSGDVRALIDHGPFLPEDALRAGLSTTSRTKMRSTTKLRAGARQAHIDGDDYARVSRRLARPEQGAAHRGDLRGRRRSPAARAATTRVNGAGGRLRHADRLHPPGAARQLVTRHRAAHRQPGRIGDRLRRDLARADARARGARRSAARSRRCPTWPRRAATTSRCRRT